MSAEDLSEAFYDVKSPSEPEEVEGEETPTRRSTRKRKGFDFVTARGSTVSIKRGRQNLPRRGRLSSNTSQVSGGRMVVDHSPKKMAMAGGRGRPLAAASE